MMVFKRKQIVVLSLVLMIVVAGYLQYSYNKSGVSVNEPLIESEDVSVGEADEDISIGEALYVDNTITLEDEKKDDKKKEDEDKSKDKSKEDNKAMQASKEANNFFAQAKMDRDVTRAKDTEALEDITKDTSASKELKSHAYEQMIKILGNSDTEMRIETLIKNKGFSDVVVLFGNDGSVDIVVKAPSISSAEATQIADIAARQANVAISDVHVRNIY